MSDSNVTRTGVLLAPTIAVCALALAISARTPVTRADDAGLQAAPALLVTECVEVGVGEQFDLSIRASGVGNLLAWEVYFAYNRHLLEVISTDVHQLLNTGRGANVVDFSDPVPNSTGFYRMGAADLGPGDSPKQGDVLVRLTLQAKTEGVSPSSIFRGDYSGDGNIDYGPTLTAPGPQYIGDADGDQRFDGTISSGQIAIGTGCVQPVPELQPDESAAIPAPVDTESGNEGTTTTEDAPDNGPAGSDANSDSADANNEDPAADPGSEQNTTTNDRAATGNPRNPNQPNEGGLGSGFLPWLLVGLGVAVAGAGGIAFYMIRIVSREPY